MPGLPWQSAKRETVLLDDRQGGLHVALTSVGLDDRTQVQISRGRVNDPEGLLKATGADDLQYPRRLIRAIPERVPLGPRLEDQVAHFRDMFLASGVEPDSTFKDEAELVLFGVPVHRRGDRVGCEEVLHHRKPAAPVLGIDEKPVPTAIDRPKDVTFAGADNF